MGVFYTAAGRPFLRWGHIYGYCLRLPKKCEPEGYRELWDPLMRRLKSRARGKIVNRDLVEHIYSLSAFKARVELWHARLNAEKIEDTPLEALLDRA